MGKTITEKILAKAAGKSEVSPGEYLEEVRSTRPIILGDVWQRGPKQMKEMGFNRVFNPRLIVYIDGHTGASASHQAGAIRRTFQAWCKEMGVPDENIYLVGRSGIEHVFAAEKCFALPGECFFEMADGHTPTLGALGAFAITLSYGSGEYLMTGKTWIKVPESAKFIINGKLPDGVFARDVFEYILGQIGPGACAGQVMEFAGSTVDEMDMDGRFSLCTNALFTGAWTAIINPDQKTLDYVKARTSDPFEPLVSDPDAQFAKVYKFDVSGMVPQVVPPPKRHIVKPVTEFTGTWINSGFIGACDNGWMEDMRIAAKILKGRKLHQGVILNITPGTQNIFKQAMNEGLIDIFLDAGAIVPAPCCGMCWGANTPLAAGDVCISTGTCNYPGRMGSREAEIYAASSATVAASCVEGKITDPRTYF